ncbi:unnamed protein product [Ranitomeya imitator]|uniref:Anaphase-promoting complex subunit 1 n=1 Tax=Ranitomeya imitator TaxID=111125 RepID=A0ABN9L7X1_9NEOB|nr:unnamed protein product [Ranitomeya imitator]
MGHAGTAPGAAKLGTMDISITRLLSIHIPALLPPTSTELDVPHNVQVAAVIGIGMVYQGTAHRHIAEVLLAEIGRPPGPEMEYCTDRESYSLAAGLALGMVCVGASGRGSDASSEMRRTTEAADAFSLRIRCPIVRLSTLSKGKHERPSISDDDDDDDDREASESTAWPLSESEDDHGSNLIGMSDLNVPEQLYQYMVGGHKRSQVGVNREKHKSPSYQIKVSLSSG